jgi:hypothetical protein
VRLALTHLLLAGPRRPADAVAVSAGARHFVPGWLPCGECGRCRRGWLAACPRGRVLVEAGVTEVEVPDRFVVALDDLGGVPPLEDARAACAGVVAELQELSARVGLGSGDLAVWIGDGARATLGARLSAARGCATFHLRSATGLGTARDQDQDQDQDQVGGGRIRMLSRSADAQTWSEVLAAAAAAAPGGFLERRLFVERAEPELVEAALALAVPGTSIGFIEGTGTASLPLGELSSCRVIVAAGRGYHPDLLPEALAALRRDPTLTDDLIAVDEGGDGARFGLRRI